MFIRAKKIKGKDYAYLVRNKWTRKGARQKVSQYLGRMHSFPVEKEVDFFTFLAQNPEEYMEKNQFPAILNDLIRWELAKHGFIETDGEWKKGGIAIQVKYDDIIEKGKSLVLKLNEGFLCGYTLMRLRRYNPAGELEDIGYDLAERFVLAGIAIPKELFVAVFEKLVKSKGKKI